VSPKPVLSLRKPPTTTNVDAFVNGVGESVPALVATPAVALATARSPDGGAKDVAAKPAAEKGVPASRKAVEGVSHEALVARVTEASAVASSRKGRGLLTRASGRQTRRMTIYVSPELAKKVVRHCALEEREISDLAEEALT
jgi:hypothetical protein